MDDRSHLLTEQRLPESMDLDRMTIEQAVALMSEQDKKAVEAVIAVRPMVVKAIERVVKALKSGGRLIYVGAGTSGRIGSLDAFECPPTFSTPPEMVQAIIADLDEAMSSSKVGAEDILEAGTAAIDAKKVGPKDVVMGIAAGGTTPYVRGAVLRAKELGAGTIFMCCVQPNPVEPVADIMIRVLTGPEILTGSTRMKAGTATKLVVNQITTVAMIQLGKVYQNLMVDLTAYNIKLWDRATRIVSTITELNRQDSRQLVERAGGEVKTAIVMHFRKAEPDTARKILTEAKGNLRTAIAKS